MTDITKHIEDYYVIADREAERYADVPARKAASTFDAAAWTLAPEFVPAPTEDNPHAMRRQGPLSYRHRDGRLVVDRDRSRRIAFEVLARNEYFDLEPVRREYRRLGRKMT